MKLYHYVHCPFCVRIRMAAGFLDHSYESVVLAYDDEETPNSLLGKKMLPIVEFKDKTMSNESLDIIKKLDATNRLGYTKLESLDLLLNSIGTNVHSMAMPYWVWTPEFNDSSRAYFQDKKEIKRGPFNDLIHKREDFEKSLTHILHEDILSNLKPFYNSDTLGLADILIASHLWGMYIVPEFQFPIQVHQYLQMVGKECKFNYHEDFWK